MISPLLPAVGVREIWLMSYLGFTWLLGIELRSLCFNGKYFTDWATSPILHTDLCEIYVKSTILPLQWWMSDAIYAVLLPPVQSITKHLNLLFVIVLKHISFFLSATVFRLYWLPSSGYIWEMEGVDKRWQERENHRVIVSRSGLHSSDANGVLRASGAPAKLCTSAPLTLARCGNHFLQLLNSGFPHFSITFSSS